MKTLSEVKRKIDVGSEVFIRNYLKDVHEKRRVTKKNTVSISTYSPKALNGEKSTVKNGADIMLMWQRARDTRIVGNKVRFLANEDTIGAYEKEALKEQGLDYWLELEVL